MGEIRRRDERYCCRFQAQAPAHHARLGEIERDPFDALAELVGIAATWHELEYSEGEALIEPHLWPEFAETHRWERPDRVLDLMLSLASLAREPYRIDPVCIEDVLATRSPLLVSPWPGNHRRGNVSAQQTKTPYAVATVTAISAAHTFDQDR